ncbi:helix-turn-helix transcriptional regulator [candidate division KSB1 bacterium]
MPEKTPRYITEKQVAEITNLALSTLRNQRFEGVGIPYYKFGKAVRYLMSDVIEYCEKRKIKTLTD